MSANSARVLIVDDEPEIVRALTIVLHGAGYAVEAASTKATALQAVSTRPPEAVVLDLVLPDGDGIAVCQAIRRWSRLPILVLSAVGDEREKVRALDAGAEDRVVCRDSAVVHLTPIEFDLLRVLAQHPGRLVTQRQLLQEVWGPQYVDESHYLRVHIAHIRAKLEPDPARPRYIITEPGIGYRLRDSADPG